MEKLLVLLFLLAAGFNGLAQMLTVRDAATGNAVPYASVFLLLEGKTAGGVSCSESGTATLPQVPYDAIRVSCIGYRDKLVRKDRIGKEVLLEEEEIRLNEVIIGNNTFSVNFYKGEEGSPMALGRDSEQVVYFRNPAKKPAAINTFSATFYKTGSECIARLLMYAVPDTLHHDKPGENLLRRDILLTIEPGTEGRKTFDLSGYNIVLPPEGAYIGLEEVKNMGETVRYKTIISNEPVYLYWQKYLGLPWYNLNRLLVVLYHKDFERRRDQKEFRVPAWGITIQTD